jgi:tetratricopeptide (TPR) repeat protein
VDIRCDVCGQEAPGGAWFRIPGESPRTPPAHRCPACFARKEKAPRHRLLYLFLAWTLLGYAAVVVAPAGHFGWFVLNVSLFLAVFGLLIILHELGHAVAGWLLGLRVFAVEMGHGPLLATGTVGGTRWEVRAVLSRGVTRVGNPDLRAPRLKHFLFILAGPLVDGAVLIAVLCWRPPSALWEEALDWPGHPGLLVLPAVAAASGYWLLASLNPLAFDATGEAVGTDAQQLLTTPNLSPSALEQAHATYFALEGDACRRAGRPKEALEWCRRGLERYPRDPSCALGAVWALVALRELEQAMQRSAVLLASEDLDQNFRALAADAMATLALLRLIVLRVKSRPGGAPAAPEAPPPPVAELLAEGARWFQEALEVGRRLPAPTQWAFMGTWGCLLVEQGEVGAGAEVLLLALEEVESPAAKGVCLSYLAVAAARRGLAPQARAALEKARRLAPESIALERAEWELAQGA